MGRRLHARSLAKRLTEQGLLPPNCGKVELLIPPDGALTLRYEVYVTDEDLAKLGTAFTDMAADFQKENGGE